MSFQVNAWRRLEARWLVSYVINLYGTLTLTEHPFFYVNVIQISISHKFLSSIPVSATVVGVRVESGVILGGHFREA
jgi:hypothetical protein